MSEQGQAPKQLTKEEQEDLQKRTKEFNERIIPILKELKLGLKGTPFISPDGRLGAIAQVFDASNLPEQPKVEDKPAESSELAEA